ncbi:phage tail tape measure protein [Tritonibacter mobilis]|uniref:Phage tail protein n=1 Tax=Tritonibacter mobilis F1926 TaxID=1265309 RepID=A0A1B1A2D4_9RHOB|nr:phage tail tape measure protein [Tritonibacter mobilis]ANP40711.1 phage tail protein [Tritonibacter mobilis F1926]KJZ24952.1 tail protein [Tritonibacter mobilis]MBU3035588.1 phage tail tape measure protein [Tritonibacter mobilis]WHQ81171.1 phage tail tape measure protein [Tritonibacter mobilis]
MANTTDSDFESQAGPLEDSLGDAAGMAAQFTAEMDRVRAAFAATQADAADFETGLSRGLRRAMKDLVVDGDSLSDALESLAKTMINTTFNSAMRPVTDHLGGLVSDGIGALVGGILPFADGAAFSQGKVTPFARGGVVSSPTHFPMRGGLGLMGEAGPEAILPLARGHDGSLGVKTQGGGKSPTVVMNVTTPDVAGFQRSRGQIAAQMSRMLARGNRNR